MGAAVFTPASAACGLASEPAVALGPVAGGALTTVRDLVAGKLAGRRGARLPMPVGQGPALAGVLMTPYVDAGTPPVVVALLPVPMALGCALTVPPLTAAMTVAVPADRAGLAAGVLDSARRMAGALGIAVFGALVSDGFVAGMWLSVVISAALLAVTYLLSFRLAGPSSSSA
ncbi:hypothetical protein ACWCPI_02555 [Streptomyces sp. NPDC001920]